MCLVVSSAVRYSLQQFRITHFHFVLPCVVCFSMYYSCCHISFFVSFAAICGVVFLESSCVRFVSSVVVGGIYIRCGSRFRVLMRIFISCFWMRVRVGILRMIVAVWVFFGYARV